MKKYILSFIIFILLLSVNLFSVFSQDSSQVAVGEKSDPTLEFQYLKNNDGSISLICNLGLSKNREIKAITNAVINFYAGTDFQTDLGSAVTSKKGKAVCVIPKGFKIPFNADGKVSYKAEFAGNDTMNSAEEQTQIKDLTLEMKLEEHDSVRNVVITAYEITAKSIKMPLRNEVINVYVPRMFSMLKIAEAKLDSFGNATVVFPHNIPGDSIGNLKIIVKLEEHSEYGNVEKYEVKKWGTPATKRYLLIHRALWTAVAPVWMIISLTIMLVGVWAHYLYVIFRLILISREGKKQEEYKIY
jgi:hypothetical protein